MSIDDAREKVLGLVILVILVKASYGSGRRSDGLFTQLSLAQNINLIHVPTYKRTGVLE